jgi:hypothetical protein
MNKSTTMKIPLKYLSKRFNFTQPRLRTLPAILMINPTILAN